MNHQDKTQTDSNIARHAPLPLRLVAALCVAGLPACATSTGISSDGGVSDMFVAGDGGTVPDGCTGPDDCDDGIECTNDICGASGACIHTPVPALCAVGSSCDPVTGCVAGIACASDEDCADSNACTQNEACNPVSATCTFTILDNDRDGDPPRVCGGTDCDDSNDEVNAAMGEICGNLIDDDCDGVVDTDATVTSDTSLRNDEDNCGTCGNACTGDDTCYQGSCIPCGGSAGAACCDLNCNASTCGYSAAYCGEQMRCDDDGNNGSCAPCGTIGGVCCRSNHGVPPCGSSGLCDVPNDTCVPCGGIGQRCCALLPGCNPGAACTSTPSGNFCMTCGGANQPCCTEGTECAGGITCNAGTCSCGGDLEPCCPGGTCTGGRQCEHPNSGPSTLCHAPSCGGVGEPCCGSDSCFGANLYCDRTTSMCAVFTIDAGVPDVDAGWPPP